MTATIAVATRIATPMARPAIRSAALSCRSAMTRSGPEEREPDGHREQRRERAVDDGERAQVRLDADPREDEAKEPCERRADQQAEHPGREEGPRDVEYRVAARRAGRGERRQRCHGGGRRPDRAHRPGP